MGQASGKAQNQKLLRDAITRHRAGDTGGAARLYRQIIAQDEGNADAYQLLGVIAQQMGQAELAVTLMETALRHQPRHAPALANLSLLLRAQGDLAGAEARARAATEADPSYAEGQIALGGVLGAKQDYAGALAAYDKARARQPQNIMLLNDIANAARRAGHWGLAHEAITHALKLAPETALLQHTHGNVLRAAGYADLATAAFAEAVRLDPALNEAEQNLALCRLLLGEMTEGWQLYAKRGKVEARYAGLRLWDRRSAGTLLVYAEQGLGDTLQFVRLLPAAQAIAGSIVAEVQAPVLGLLRHSFPGVTFITPEDEIPAAAAQHCRLLDLAQWCKAPAAPYLQAPPTLALAAKLAALPMPRVGLAWAGNPGHLNDANRSIRLAQLVPVLGPYQDHIVALQKGEANKELAQSGLRVTDGGSWCDDFAATAALMAQLDLVVTVDTSVAHLAGGLGKPVWLLLPYDPDWRWQLQRRDTPWYPAMTLYRQAQPQDWQAPLQALAADLARFMAGDASVLAPPAWQGLPARRAAVPVKLPV